ncbi:ArsR/SmtB family transcription factor [Brevundimonas sp.]|uniref:ArsR/SmtB family transcription factor n=1 Tax=Brevundimonas sp. TaxID=1871086 RepID=UPI0035B38455
MENLKIKKPSNWSVLDQALSAWAEGSGLPPKVYTALADRLRTAIESTDATRIQTASDLLQAAFQSALVASPASVQAAARGEGAHEMATGYALGKLAFAQLLAGRIADTRADSRFVEHVRNRHYLPYLQALFGGPLTVNALQLKVGTRLETVSRKLAVLRELGLVASRRQGTEVINILTPAAAATMEALGLNPVVETVPVVRAPDVREALDGERNALPSHMRGIPSFAERPARLHKAA